MTDMTFQEISIQQTATCVYQTWIVQKVSYLSTKPHKKNGGSKTFDLGRSRWRPCLHGAPFLSLAWWITGSVHQDVWGILGGTRVIGVIARHHWHRSAFTSKALTNFLCSCPCTAAARGKPAQIQENQMKAISRHVPVKMSYQSNKFCAMCSWSCQVLGEPEVAEPNQAPCPWPSIGSLPEMDKARFFCTKASHGFLDIWIMVLNGSISGDMNGYEWLLLTING
jgi:hypothetical protein